jgi:hypothetical protein
MQVHNWHALGWAVWAVATSAFFALWEWEGMASRDDNRYPLTHYIRGAVQTWRNPLWWVLGAILIWMFVHFLFVHE